ncbi:hypothetical protein [Paraliomyxa miuraensis]|uniref:hypothetical protein n=1 Tax=Paraliomyxa miuraensis TaxID=376150 RepID=UPI002259B2DA|nr:hypothetical protein [Paraliomyxa miuraensis]MCX4244074.1 hypothetical protein [Paraliomyxa miuraensis]
MQRAAACLGIVALAAAMGAMVVGELVVRPGLEAQAGLVDLNLLTRIIAPVQLRCTEIALVGAVVLLGVAPYWLRSRLATTLALLTVASTGALRMAVLPSLYEAWSRVDRVALAPYEPLMRAEGLAEDAYWLGLGSITMLVLMGVLAGLHWIVPVPQRRMPHDTPTLSDDAHTTDETPVATTHAA